MKLVLLLIALYTLPMPTLAQIRIGGPDIKFRGIPIYRIERSPQANGTTETSTGFSYILNGFQVSKGDTFTVEDSGKIANEVQMLAVSFRLDTAKKMMYQFSYKLTSSEERPGVDSAWGHIITSFDSIQLFPYENILGRGHRGFISGNQLAQANLKYSMLYSEIYAGEQFDEMHNLRWDGYGDNSTIEVIVYDTSFFSSVGSSSSNREIAVYPNPATTELYVSHSEDFNKVAIFDMLGRKLQEIVIVDSKINISNLNSGIYWLQIGAKMTKFCKR